MNVNQSKGHPSRILVAMDNRQDENWGSRATTNGLIQLIGATFPDAEIRGVPRSVARCGGGLGRRVVEWLGPIIQLKNRWSTPEGRIVRSLLLGPWMDLLSWSDLVIVNGEGTLHPQRQTNRWLPALSYATDEMSKPLWVVNCSINFEGTAKEKLFRSFLSKPAFVAVREPYSYRELCKLGIPCTLAADCAFLTTPAPLETVNRVRSELGLSKDFAVITGTSRVREWRVDDQRSLFDYVRSLGLDLVYASSSNLDDENFKILALDVPLINHAKMDEKMLMTLQSRARILIGGRFHPMILAAKVGTPFVAFPGNTTKNHGLLEMLHCEGQMSDFNDLKGQMSLVDKTLAHRESLSSHLIAAAKECEAAVTRNIPS